MKIKEVSEKLDISAHTLRYYEKIGLLRNIERDANKSRLYDSKDIEWLKCILQLKQTGMPLEDIQVYADSYYNNNENRTVRIELLLKHEKHVIEEIKKLKDGLKYIDHKLLHYGYVRTQ